MEIPTFDGQFSQSDSVSQHGLGLATEPSDGFVNHIPMHIPDELSPEIYNLDPMAILDTIGTDFSSNLGWILQSCSDNLNLSTSDFTFDMGLEHSASPSFQLQHPIRSMPHESLFGHQTQADPAAIGLRTPCTEEAGLPWHVDPHAESERMVLPSLEIDMEQCTPTITFCSTKPISDAAYATFREIIGLPFRSPWQPIDGISLLKFDCLLTEWQRLPIIHQPTFDPDSSAVVTLAMICAGARYTNSRNSRAFSMTLSELNRRVLISNAEYDRKVVYTEEYLIAQVLQGFLGYASGSQHLFELSEVYRSSLVHNARYMGLFLEQSPTVPMATTPENVWREWIRRERSCRLAWAEYDASVAFLHNSRSYIIIEDMKLSLPSSPQHWNAESSYAWKALHPWTNLYPPTVKLRPLIRSLLDGSPNAAASIENERHRHLTIMTLIRMLWSIKEIKLSTIADLVPHTLDNSREPLVHALNSLVQSPAASSLGSRSDVINIAVHAQNAHTAHFIAAGDLLNWLWPVLRGFIEERHRIDSRTANAIMSNLTKDNLVSARDVTYRSAQVLALARRYPTGWVYEPFNVFHAGVVLYLMAGFLPPHVPADPTVKLRIDDLQSAPNSPNNVQIQAWVRDGGNAIIGLDRIPVLCCNEGRQAILEHTGELLRNGGWGIGLEFAKLLFKLRGPI
ncbi:hypothetical protein N7457_008349 [Penicillium paradoxum]|uniref:uncharacterized protein n=1 Tax=Penicillium paradoxum TaxID=176176 RepID=UPI002549BA97|nr:uncharacterized protein N7457_008349 [Penicillium paradoxum]KAJ5773453.1 hypothetical protein N7457_008349 [Penicillium paradoxum]